jgi:hypothetical protein
MKLAEAKRAAEAKAMEWKLAEARKAAETKLAETRLAVETTIAEGKLAEAKLAETKRAVEMKILEAKLAETQAAFESRNERAPANPVYARQTVTKYSCDTCGTVGSIVSRFLGGSTNSYEVRVNFEGGSHRIFYFPTDPGFSTGERVRFAAGRLLRM